VSFADGIPVTQGSVTFTSSEHGYSETSTITDDGSFHFSVVTGMTGQLHAEIQLFGFNLTQCPQFTADPNRGGFIRFVNSIPISVSAEADQENLKLGMPSPSCQFWPVRGK
jgi:hypothetical protein